MSKKKQQKREKNNKANGPIVEYGLKAEDKKIIFFSSFEEENEYTYKRYAEMTPQECLAAVTFMRLTTYPYLDTNLNPWGNTVYFD